MSNGDPQNRSYLAPPCSREGGPAIRGIGSCTISPILLPYILHPAILSSQERYLVEQLGAPGFYHVIARYGYTQRVLQVRSATGVYRLQTRSITSSSPTCCAIDDRK